MTKGDSFSVFNVQLRGNTEVRDLQDTEYRCPRHTEAVRAISYLVDSTWSHQHMETNRNGFALSSSSRGYSCEGKEIENSSKGELTLGSTCVGRVAQAGTEGADDSEPTAPAVVQGNHRMTSICTFPVRKLSDEEFLVQYIWTTATASATMRMIRATHDTGLVVLAMPG